MKCETCAFFSDPGSTTLEDGSTLRYGFCRRYPPQVLELNQSQSPIVQAIGWCGEHKPVGSFIRRLRVRGGHANPA